jgi:hypothetical protein
VTAAARPFWPGPALAGCPRSAWRQRSYGHGSPRVTQKYAGQERKALSQLGRLFHHLFLNVKRLFHMLVGLAFMVLTVAGASLTLSEWMIYRKTPEEGLVHFTMFGGFTILLAILCLYTFVKARNVR